AGRIPWGGLGDSANRLCKRLPRRFALLRVAVSADRLARTFHAWAAARTSGSLYPPQRCGVARLAPGKSECRKNCQRYLGALAACRLRNSLDDSTQFSEPWLTGSVSDVFESGPWLQPACNRNACCICQYR